MLPRTLSSPFRATVVAIAILVALPGLGAPPPALGAGTATTTTIELDSTTVPPTFDATVSVRPNPVVEGQVGTCVMVDLDGVNGICLPLDPNGDVVASFVDVPFGAHVIHAAFAGGGAWIGSAATASVDVVRQSWVEIEASPDPASSSDLVTVVARVNVTGDLSGGWLSIEDSTTGILLADTHVGPTRNTVSVTRRFPAGDHPLVAFYSGTSDIAEASAPLTVHITADARLDWLGMSKVAPTFYPVVDGYQDTLRVSAVIDEPAAVVIRIKDANGHFVRTKDLGARKAGTVAWAWDGRNGSGTLLPAGAYTVVVRATDMSGNSETMNAATSLSRKRLHWYTQTVTRHGDGYAYSWDPGDGTISQTRSAYADGVRLTAGEAFVGVRYTFTLRAATVYGSLKFQVLGRSPAGLSSVAGLWRGAMDDPKVSADLARPYDRSRIGPAYGWWTVSKSSAHRDGRRVHAQVLVENALLLVGGGLNTYDIKAVRLVYRYALLQ